MIQRAKPNHRRTIRASAIAILIAAGSSISAESVSFAADMPVKAPVYTKAPVAVATQNWSGFYIGGNVGEVQEHSTGISDFLDGLQVGNASFSNPQRDSFSNMRVIGGLQGGYNWQFDPRWVVGVEADWDWTHSHYSFCRQPELPVRPVRITTRALRASAARPTGSRRPVRASVLPSPTFSCTAREVPPGVALTRL